MLKKQQNIGKEHVVPVLRKGKMLNGLTELERRWHLKGRMQWGEDLKGWSYQKVEVNTRAERGTTWSDPRILVEIVYNRTWSLDYSFEWMYRNIGDVPG